MLKLHGWVGGVSSIAVIAVGLALFVICRKYVKWRITLAYLAATALFALGLNFVYGGDPILRVVYRLFVGSSIFLAFFMATDPATTPLTPLGTSDIRGRLRHIVHSVSSILQLPRWLDRRVGHNEFDFTAVG